jgi:phosphotransferase system IIA component
VAGRVAKVHPHALAIADGSGAGVLVHLGIDTVKMNGAGFTLHVADGDELEVGADVITWDPTAVRAAGYSAVCPVVILGSPADSVAVAAAVGSAVAPGDELFSWSPAS